MRITGARWTPAPVAGYTAWPATAVSVSKACGSCVHARRQIAAVAGAARHQRWPGLHAPMATMPSQSQPSGAPNEARSPASRLLVALILVAPALVIAAYWALAIAPSKHSLAPAPPQHATPAIQPGPRSAQSPASPDGTPAAGVPEDAEEMAMRLAARLEREPQDANGWRTLARTWYVMARFPEAVAAYEKLAALGPLDADVLADYADATAMAQGGELAGAPMELVHSM